MSKISWRASNMLYPLPAVMVSCCRPGERPNILTVAWAGTVCSDPVMVAIGVRKERYSYDILKETGEYVINLTTEALAAATDYCGVNTGAEVDKFAETGLTAAPAPKLSWAPAILESPISLECKVKQVLPLGSHDLFIAEVVEVLAEESLLDEAGRLNLERAGLMTYCHGHYYALGAELGKFGFSVRKKPEKVARKSEGNFKKNESGYKKSGEGTRKSEGGFRKSENGYKKSGEGYRKSGKSYGKSGDSKKYR